MIVTGTRVLAFVVSLVLVIAAASVAVQAQPNDRGRSRGGAPPNGREGGRPEWAQPHQDPVSVPEPSTLLLLAVGAGGLAVKAVRNRRSRKL